MPLRALALVLALLAVLPATAGADPAHPPDPSALPPPPDVSAPPRTATRTASGLAYLRLTRGAGTRHPSTSDRCEVHYTGWTTDGRMFDSSVTRGQSATFPVTAVIPGFSEALQLMVEGDRIRVWIPADLAYGTSGRAGAPSGMLVFEIELLHIL